MPEGITVTGLPEVQRNLAEFPRLLVSNCFSVALSRAAAVFERELAARCPEAVDGATSDEEFGRLLENLMSIVEVDSNGRGGRAQIGFGKKGFVAMFIEYGHRKVSHSGTELGFVPANPFMRQSFSAAANKAIEVFEEVVKEYLSSGNIQEAA